jgi:hypothetical protein
MKWKIETYILIFQTQKIFTKRINVEFKVEFAKDGTSKSQSKLPQKIIIMDFFLLVELETKPITFYCHTLKYHNI